MNIGTTIISKDPDEFPYWDFAFLDVEYDPEAQAVWMNYKSAAPQHFPLEMFIEIVKLRESLRGLRASECGARWPIRYLAIGSKRPGVFSLGGDLAAFAVAVRNGEHEMLRAHANICVDIKGLDAFDPQIDYVMKLFARHRETPSTRLREGAALPPAILAAFPHPGCRRFMRPALGRQDVDNAKIEHFLAGIDRAAGNNPLRQGLPRSTCEQGNRAHSGKSVEADFRQTEFGVTLDDKEVGHEGAFEASAQALTVHGRKRHDRQVKSHVQTMHADHDLRHMDRLVAAQRRLSRARLKPARNDASTEQAVGSLETVTND
jgi:DSF synthase